ncbi:lectin C-type domain protein [Cooperia oncophora]
MALSISFVAVAVVLICSPKGSLVSAASTDDWTFDPETEQGYKVFKEAVTWEEARSKCKQFNADLASIGSPQENEFIHGLVHGTWEWYWIGGKRYGSAWTWVDGTEWGYTYWSSDEPNNDGGMEFCLERMFLTPYQICENVESFPKKLSESFGVQAASHDSG